MIGARVGRTRTSCLFCWSLAFLVLVWSLAVISGLGALLLYKRTPGQAAKAPMHWPNDCPIQRRSNERVLLLFAHPKCPCTRATLSEMERLLATERDLRPHVILFDTNNTQSWGESDIVSRSMCLPGAKTYGDADGRLQQMFNVTTSGHVLLYDKDGRNTYSGGITGLRGHEGENCGLAKLRERLAGRTSSPDSFPVLGCPLGSYEAARTEAETP
jgi:hypothetical protein